VPAGYLIAGGQTSKPELSFEQRSCEGLSIDQSKAQPTELSQIGINLVAPDRTSDINNCLVLCHEQ
jgi:hypothetical protein